MHWAFDQYETVVANDRASAIAQVRRFEPAVVTMDLGLPPQPDDPSEGFKLLEEMHTLVPDTKVIVLTGQNDRANALKAIGLGAYDFCTKPFEPELLTLDDRSRLSRARTAGGEPPPAGVAGIGCRIGHHHARPGDAADLPHDRESRADIGHRADPRRVGHRQGTARARAARPVAAQRRTVSSRSIAPRFRRPCSRASCSATRKARSPGAVKQTLGKIETAARRHAVPRRDRRPADLAAGEAAALPAGARHRAHRRPPGDSGRRADRLRHASEPQGRRSWKGGSARTCIYRLAEIVVEIPPLRDRPRRCRAARARLRAQVRRTSSGGAR